MTNPNTIVKPNYAKAVSRWLFVCALLVACMVVLGGYTRLSGSGLSITEWKPVHGVIPPMGAQEWQEEFAVYQGSPQYQKVNQGMTLEQFKRIYWPEYFHRLLGRAVGAVFLLPFLWFVARRAFMRRFAWRLAGIFLLGGLQGAVGWYMVKSGLVDDPQVSHIRLATHLSLAFALLALLLWSALDAYSIVTPRLSRGPDPAIRRGDILKPILLLLSLQIILGALLAGLHGGLIYNTFPTMDGAWLPPAFDRLTLIQFAHRWLAVAVLLAYGFWWFAARIYAMKGPLGAVLNLLPLAALLQVVLGIATLLHQAPLPLALAHQCAGLALFALTITGLHGLTHADAD